MNKKNIIIGAVIAGAVGGIATALYYSKPRKNSFLDICEDYGDKIKSVVGEYSNFDVSGIIDTVKEQIEDLPDMDNKDFIKGIVIGAALAGLVSGGTAIMGGKNGNLKSFSKNIMNAVDCAKNSSTTQDFIDLAHAGLKCWNKFAK